MANSFTPQRKQNTLLTPMDEFPRNTILPGALDTLNQGESFVDNLWKQGMWPSRSEASLSEMWLLKPYLKSYRLKDF
jgi:hypothetical protein